MPKPRDSECKGPWSVPNSPLYYDQWVEPGQVRQAGDNLALVIGATDEQDRCQHDRTIKWLVLVNDRLVTEYLSEIGEWWLVHPAPSGA